MSREHASSTEASPRDDRSNIRLLLAGRYRQLSCLAGTSVVGGLLEAAFLVLLTQIAFTITDTGRDAVEVASVSLTITQAIGLALALIAARVAVGVLTTWQSANLTTSVTKAIRAQLAEAFLHASWETQHDQKPGWLQHLLTAFTAQGSGLVASVTTGVSTSVSLVTLLIAAVWIDAGAALVAIAVLVVLGLVLRPLRARVRRQSSITAHTGMDFATSLNEISQLGMEMHVFNVQPIVEARVRSLVDQNESATRRLSIMQGLLPAIYGGMAYVALVVALAVISMSDSADVGSAGAAMVVMLRSLTYGKSLQTVSADIHAALPFVQQLQEELASYQASAVVDHGAPVDTLGTLALENVSFAYVPGQLVLKNISIEIDPREVVGVIGPSGSGKSTLVQLLLGLRSPTSGRVLADGREVALFSRAEWARKVTFVPQDAHLVAGTISDNIRFYRDDITQAEIEQAARLANLHDDVSGFPEGYDRQVGEGGGQLSGGQQQRLIIARALVEQPEMLVLDEPTSALDVRSESAIRATIEQLRERMTIVIIAHRLSTLNICDRLMVIQDGELVGFDTPELLESSSDFYREALALSGLR